MSYYVRTAPQRANLLALAEIIEDAEVFDMKGYAAFHEVCTTPSCILGHAIANKIIAQGVKPDGSLTMRAYEYHSNLMARKIIAVPELGLLNKAALELFDPDAEWQERSDAAAKLRELANEEKE